MNIAAGDLPHFDYDLRVDTVSAIYNLAGKSVLELGPLEAYQTRKLCLAGASLVTAVEGNDISFLKCLIVKEIFGINAEFLHGDFTEFLKSSERTFDVIWASGVLYHQTDPLLLLKLMCDRASAIYVWSHYWDEQNLGSHPHAFVPDEDITRRLDGFAARYHARTYGGANFRGFSGGSGHSYHYWMERSEILRFIEQQGFSIRLDQHQLDAPPGPAMTVFATRGTCHRPAGHEMVALPRSEVAVRLEQQAREIAALAGIIRDGRVEFAEFRRTVETALGVGWEEIKSLKRRANNTLIARLGRAVRFRLPPRKFDGEKRHD